MIYRRHFRRLCPALTLVIVFVAFVLLFCWWSGISQLHPDIVVQDGQHYLLRKSVQNILHLKAPTSQLDDIVRRVDLDQDQKLTREEIEAWIISKTKEHLDQGDREIANDFRDVDIDQSGFVGWDEFFVWHKKHPDKSRNDDQLKDEWKVSDADANNVLDKKEFLCFRHPELCQATLRQLALDVIKNLDKNGDGLLSEEEYSAPAPGQVEDGFQDYEISYTEQRKKEFKVIDTNQDGQVGQRELEVFLNPRNHIHAKSEADELVDAADESGDGFLSQAEIAKHRDLFEQSKLVDVGDNFHNDF